MKIWMLNRKTWLEKLNAISAFLNTAETKYAKFRNLWIQIIRDSDAATMDVGYDVISRAAALAWSAGTNSYISKRYNQISGKADITISSSSDQELIITSDSWVNNTAKYCLFEPSKSLLSVMDIPLSVNGRMKNKALAAYIIQKDDKIALTGYTSDYVFPVKCAAGLMDFGWTNLNNIYWYLAGGSSSTNARPGVTLLAGVSYSFGTNMQDGNIALSSNGSFYEYIGDLNDMPKLVYSLDLICFNATGNLSSLGNRITHRLRLPNSNNIRGRLIDVNNVTNWIEFTSSYITGSLSDLQGKITYRLRIINNNNITGFLSDLQGKITYYLELSSNLIAGVYTPSSNTTTPTTFNIAGTGMSASDVDDTLIACNQPEVVKNGVTFTWTGLSRTSASDAAKLDLKTNHSWTFNPDT
jgi:hypothetical protein